MDNQKSDLPVTYIYLFTAPDGEKNIFLDNWEDFYMDYQEMSNADFKAGNYKEIETTEEEYKKMFPNVPDWY